jgi:phenylalanyl-tRNA synthetase beta chain
MKVSKSWLPELVDLKISIKDLEGLLPLRTIATKEVNDNFLELDMKGYNRADLLSMRGVAREVAAITNSETIFQEPEKIEANLPPTKTKIEAEKLCPVYCIAKIEGLKSGTSKPEWVKKLSDSGMRTVNNIADITNLIMLEYGQPMHSFDSDKVKDETLIVRTAKPGETIKTLDDKVRKLDESDLLIADSENPLGIAGVMGGKDSEATETTTSILLEAAIFDPIAIRKSVQRHNLYSEASKRFQHGLTKTNLLQALSAAIKMYAELGGKVTAISLVGDLEDKPKTVNLTLKKTNSLIGVELTEKQIEEYLQKLGFKLNSNEQGWEVMVPYWRLDINIEEDLIEEVARMYGYEKIPAQELKGELPEKIDQTLFETIYNTKKTLAEIGVTEVQTYSFYSKKVLDSLGFNENNKESIIRIANPISSETEYLREFIWPNLIEVVERNLKQGYGDIAVFEIGKVYIPQKGHLPKESYRLAIALMNSSDNPVEELIAIVNQLNSVIPSKEGIQDDRKGSGSPIRSGMTIEKGGLMKELETLFHPTRFATIKESDKPARNASHSDAGGVIGGIAEVHPRFLNNFGIEKRVAILEISI